MTAAERGDLERGRALFEARAWADAFEALSAADRESPLGRDDLRRLSLAAGMRADDETMLATQERLHHAALDAGDTARAAYEAVWIALRLRAIGEHARATAFMTRAAQLLARESDETAAHGLLHVEAALRRMAAGELEAAADETARAIEIGERREDHDVVALGKGHRGRALIRMGRVAEGLALLDETMLAATEGRVSPLVTGLVYCILISECHHVHALERAREWTDVLARWCDAQPQLVMFTGSCVVHRVEIMQLGGEWPEAIAEARRVCEVRPKATPPLVVANAFYQEAEILRLRGEHDAAEQAYASANRHGREPQPGLALLRLAQGRSDAAASAISRVVETSSDGRERTRLLPAYVEIMLAVGRLDDARRAADELEAAAASCDLPVLRAMADHARGALLLAEGDARTALSPLRRAFEVWLGLSAPYIAARLRVLVAHACLALGDCDTQELELGAARDVFEKLGAAPDVAAVDALTTKKPPADTGRNDIGLSARELEVLRLVATGKTNKAIAKELFISEKTVDRHVSNIFAKLDVSSRAAATAYAYQHDLV